MNDDQLRELLPVYADGELDAALAVDLEARLAESGELREELSRWRLLRESAHRVVMSAATPTELESRVRSLVGARAGTVHRLRVRMFGGVFAAAAAIVLAVVLWPSQTTSASPRTITPDRFVEIYRHCALKHRHRGVEADYANLAAVRATLADGDAFPTLLPDLSTEGFDLDGVCRCFGEEGVRVVHAFYRRPGETPEVISVFSVDQRFKLCNSRQCPCRGLEERRYVVATTDNVTVCKWDEPCGSFAVCGQMAPEQLQDLANRMQLAARGASPIAIARAD